MRLLWLKVHASAFEDEPVTSVRRVGSQSQRFEAENDGEGELDAAAPSERRSWNVKSVPRTVAPWSSADAPIADPSDGVRSK